MYRSQLRVDGDDRYIGCASGPTVRIDKDPAVVMSQYKSFAFFESCRPIACGTRR